MMTSLETEVIRDKVHMQRGWIKNFNSNKTKQFDFCLFVYFQAYFSTQGNHPIILQVNDKRNEMTHLSVVSGLTVIK